MSRKNPKVAPPAGPSPLEWIETAAHLLRSAPAGALLCYYTGSATCLLGLLYFWADMSKGAFAAGHITESALNAAALYIWMKCWQAVFLSKLRAHLLMEPNAPWTVRRIIALAVTQAALQPAGLFLRFIAANILVPYIWTYSVFMGVAILGDGTEPSLRAVVRGAVREAGLWWRQTHLALLCLLGFALFILFNVVVLAVALPFAVRIFLGIESPFTRDLSAMFNSTFFMASFAVTYLCFDPLRKAVFLVRHFQGVSRKSGEDLRVELKTIRSRSRGAVMALALLATLLAGPLPAGRAAEPPPPAHVESKPLNESLDRVLERREYAWRLPRETVAGSEQKGRIGQFFASAVRTAKGWLRKVSKVVKSAADWIEKQLEPKEDKSTSSSSGIDWGHVASRVLIVLAAVLFVGLGLMWWRSRKTSPKVSAAQPVVAAPDLNEESVTADQLPEEGWLSVGRDLMQRGELRLALRAFYLAMLAHLGQRELIRLARHKSNYDYDRELQRLARGQTGLIDAFDANLHLFERGWYGEHAVTLETLEGVSQNIARIRAC
jgi:hypothetical protein